MNCPKCGENVHFYHDTKTYEGAYRCSNCSWEGEKPVKEKEDGLKEFNKITTGYVIQKYEKNEKGKFACTEQEFVAGDIVDCEDMDGEIIEQPDHKYQPYNMTLDK